jgi:regulator of protease activity HflC (stomatin/prohibitin superfamily)
MLKRIRIRSFEHGLVFRCGEFHDVLDEGVHYFFDPFGRIRVDVVSRRVPSMQHVYLDVIAKSGLLQHRAEIVDLKDHERGLVWIDDRFQQILAPGLYAFWTGLKSVRVEIVDSRKVRFEHPHFKTVVRWPQAGQHLDICSIGRDQVGVLFIEGRFIETLGPGEYAFWRGPAEARIVEVDERETTIEVGGQDIMTSDKVTLRINASVTYQIVDPRKAVSQADDLRQAMYREAQLALRAVIGARELDVFLADKESVSRELSESLAPRAAALGARIASIGIRDLILPGDMKELMNKVTEAKKIAEANLISRREETAAIRSQANTAKLLNDNPTLMRLRELEVLEKVAMANKLNIVLGDKGLTDRIVNMM